MEAEKLAEAVLCYVFKIALTASLFWLAVQPVNLHRVSASSDKNTKLSMHY